MCINYKVNANDVFTSAEYTLISSQLLCMDMNMGTNIKSDESHQLR